MVATTEIDFSADWESYIQKGDQEAFSRIYYSHYDLLYYVGLKYISDIQVIEDSIQNIFIYLLKHRNKLMSVSNVKGYLLKSFRRQLFYDLKKQNKLSLSNQFTEAQFDYFNNTQQASLDKEENEELNNALKKSLSKLSARQQEIIYLRFDCDLSYEEISGILEISVDSCYKSVYRSIKTMKADIELMLVKSKDLFFWFIFHFKKKF